MSLFRQRRLVATFERGPTPSNSESEHSSASAPIATRLYSLMQYHRLHHLDPRMGKGKQLEQQAWSLLQDLDEVEVKSMAAKDLAELLTAWCYFARYWDRGMDGPSPRSQKEDEVATKEEENQRSGTESIWDEVPLVTRDNTQAASSPYTQREVMAPPRRSSPLDEVLDF
ncbi:unnamed protein product [Phytomonas sp. EM1]|nr:unnamed protein product [Phytomonas sp. EM1]|eukprot:CCW61618.1 unnamed protein product [Phytomonas sp. isolate EM1]